MRGGKGDYKSLAVIPIRPPEDPEQQSFTHGI
jgi:hypothetical protein